MMENMKSEKKQLQDDSEDRKQHMQTMELKRMQNEKLTDLEQVRGHRLNNCLFDLFHQFEVLLKQ